MLKDIAYIIRSSLYLACIIATLWGVKEVNFFSSNGSFVLGVIFISSVGLSVCYLVAVLTKKIWRAKSWGDLPPEPKYDAVVLWCMTCTLSSPFSKFSVAGLLVIPIILVWTGLGTAWFSGGLSSLFEKSLKFNELALSVVLITWVFVVATVSRFGLLLGSLIGIAVLLASPVLIMAVTAILQLSFRLIGHEFFIRNENGKFVVNKIKEKDVLQHQLVDGPPDQIDLAEMVSYRIDALIELREEIGNRHFDNNRAELAKSLALYKRWKKETSDFLAQHVSPEEEKAFRDLAIPETVTSGNIDCKPVFREADIYLSHLKSLAIAISEGRVEVNTKVMQHTRYRVLHKLYEMAHTESKQVLIDDLAEALELPSNEVVDILEYWEKKKLVKAEGSRVKLTSFGIDEVKETIDHPEKPTRHFPPNIINNYNIEIQGANYGAIQQGGQDNTQTNTVYLNSPVNDATLKLIELVKASSLNELDKEEIINHAERVKDLAQRERTPKVTERAQEKIKLIESSLEVAKDAGGLAVKAAPYLAVLWNFFTKLNG
jgi:hypothetical protein